MIGAISYDSEKAWSSILSCVTLSPMVVRSEKVVQERSIAAEIEAVQRSANYGIFGLLRHKFRLSSRERQHQSQQVRPRKCPSS